MQNAVLVLHVIYAFALIPPSSARIDPSSQIVIVVVEWSLVEGGSLIRLHTHTKGKSKYIDLFIKWIVVQDEMQRRNETSGYEIKIGVKKLAIKLRMYELIKDYQWKKIREIIEECFAVGKGAGLIDSAIIEGEFVIIALPRKYGTSTHKKRNLYPQKAEPLPIKGGCEK